MAIHVVSQESQHEEMKWKICWCQGAAAAKHECCIQPLIAERWISLIWMTKQQHLIKSTPTAFSESHSPENSRIPKSSRWKMSWCSWGLIVGLNDVQSWWNGYKDPSFEASFLVFVLCSWHRCKVSVPHELVWVFFVTRLAWKRIWV